MAEMEYRRLGRSGLKVTQLPKDRTLTLSPERPSRRYSISSIATPWLVCANARGTYASGLRGTLGHSSKEIGVSSFGRLTKKTAPATTAPSMRRNDSLRRILSSPTNPQDSRREPWTFHGAAVEWWRDFWPERTAAVTGRANARPRPRVGGGIFVYLWP